MKPLIVLLATFLLALLSLKIFAGGYQWTYAGRISMAVMLLFTAMGHFKFTDGMTMMLPRVVPYKKPLIWLTGLMEIGFAVGLLLPGYQRASGWMLIVFFILVLPANIYASLKQVNYEKADFNGNGIAYLWFRVPLQALFIAWTYFSAVQ